MSHSPDDLAPTSSERKRVARYRQLLNRQKYTPLSEQDYLEMLTLDHQFRNENQAMITGTIAIATTSLLGMCPLQAMLIASIVTLTSWALNRNSRLLRHSPDKSF